MTANVTKNDFSVLTAASVLKSINTTDNANIFYIGIGRNAEWDNEPTPDEAIDAIQEEIEARDATIGIKKISAENISHVIQRKDWTSGTVYQPYSETAAVGDFTSDFYVMTDEYNVYKCISNNSDSASTEKPTGQSTSIFSTADGYQWKFMFDVPAGDALKFLTASWIPVPTGARRSSAQLAVESAAISDIFPDYTGVPVGGHGSSAIHELGAGYLMFTTDIVGDELPVATSFRQIFIWENPRDNTGDAITTTTALPSTSPDDLNVRSGRLLFLRNQAGVVRNEDQTEKLQIVISFVG